MGGRIRILLVGVYVGMGVASVGSLILMPELVVNDPHQGISIFGNYYPAVITYIIGLVTAITCLLFAAYSMPKRPKRLKLLKTLFIAIALCITGILLTPEQMMHFFYWAHLFIALISFVVVGLTAIWVFVQPGRQPLDWWFMGLIFTGAILALLSASYVAVLDYLVLGQIIFINATILVIARGAWRWLPRGR